MSDKFRDRFRIQSARAQWWDYGNDAAYFVTICTHGRECYFGHIQDGMMHLSEIGTNVGTEWEKSPIVRPDMNLKLGVYAIMPNHFHGIIIIGKNQFNIKNGQPLNVVVDENIDLPGCRDAMHCVSTADFPKNRFGPQYKNLASIIRGFKSAVTKSAHLITKGFDWQPRFYDEIIRSDKACIRISKYIRYNVSKWEDDEFFSK